MTPRDRRAVWIGTATILTAIGLLRIVPAATQGLRGALSRLHAEQQYLAAGRESLAGMPALEESTNVLTARVQGLATRVLPGETPSAATASLAGHLHHLASLYHAKLERTDPLPDSAAAGALRRVAVEVHLETDIRGLVALLGALATNPPVTEVTRLRVTAADPSLTAQGPEVLRIELRVRGWFLSSEVL